MCTYGNSVACRKRMRIDQTRSVSGGVCVALRMKHESWMGATLEEIVRIAPQDIHHMCRLEDNERLLVVVKEKLKCIQDAMNESKTESKKCISRSSSNKTKRIRHHEMSSVERSSLYDRCMKQYEYLNATNPTAAIEVYFRALLIKRGDYIGGINPKTKSCRNDGNCYKYPQYTRRFLEAGVFTSLDEFVESNRAKATEYVSWNASQVAPSQKWKGKTWDALTERQRERLVLHLFNTYMHGFDDLVSCLKTQNASS